MVFFKSAYFSQRSFLVQHRAVDRIRGASIPCDNTSSPCMKQRKVLSSPSESMRLILDLKTKNKSNTPDSQYLVCCFSVRGQKDVLR